MLKRCNEDDFQELKGVSSNRLSPDGISVGLVVALIYNVIMFVGFFSAVLFGESYNFSSMWYLSARIEVIIILMQIFLTIFLLHGVNCFRFQRIQSVVICLVFLILSISFYPIYFIICEERKISSYMVIGGIILFLGGILFLVASTIRAIWRVRKGELREGGKYLYDFSNSKGYYSIPASFGFVTLAGFISRTLSGMEGTFGSIATSVFILLICVITQYVFALAIPEFFLLAYCKFRFPSFIEPIPEYLEYAKYLNKNQKVKVKNKKTDKIATKKKLY